MQKSKLKDLKVAIVTEELTQLGGAERVLDCFIKIFPKAPIYTIVWDDLKTFGKYRNKDIRTTFIQKLPFGVKKYKYYLALMPIALEQFNFDKYDLVLSVTSALAKGIITKKPTIHICFCNTPTRYLWFDSRDYIKNAPIPFFIRPFMPIVLKYLRKWDLKASKRPNYYIANSINVQKRILKFYHQESFPIFPPVDTKRFTPIKNSGKFYLIVSRIEPYKKVDLVIETFKKNKLPLKVVGSGSKVQDFKKGLPNNIEIVGRVSDEKLISYYQNAIALIFPQEEDAGITPLEAMACARPVIAFAKGGVLESVVDNKTGILFQYQTISCLSSAIEKSKKIKFDPIIIRKHAEKFDQALFKRKILEYTINKINTTNYKKNNTNLRNTN